MADAFAVLLKNPADLVADKVAALLVSHHKQLMIDARRGARRCWGFLGEGLSAEAADALAQAAAAAGMETVVLPSVSLPALPPVKPVRQGTFTADAFVHTVGTGSEQHALPWASLHLVAAAGLMETHTSVKTVKEGPSPQERAVKMGITMVTGIPLGFGGGSKEVHKVVTNSDMALSVDLIAEGGVRLRISPQAFNFSGVGKPLAPSVLGNFKMLLEELARVAPAAGRNRGAQGFLSGTPVASHGYDTLADVEKECRWLLALGGARG